MRDNGQGEDERKRRGDGANTKKRFRAWRVLITGARSLLGQRLATRLVREGASVVHLFDIQETPVPAGFGTDSDDEKELRRKFVVFRGDILDEDAVREAAKDVDTCFHVASYGMSGAEGLNEELIHRVNVEGTATLLRVCTSMKVRRFVYTSTYNVVFGGDPSNEIQDGDEDQPYLPSYKHCDAYSRTKALAERLVLRICTESSIERPFASCAIRPAAIYGEGEWRHFGRIVKIIKSGMYIVTIGKKEARQDWVHIDNLVASHLLAAERLVGSDGGPGISAGKVYFINDGEGRNTFEFMRPLVEALGKKFPSMVISYETAMHMARAGEFLHRALKSIGIIFSPPLTRCEVNKCARMHTFRIDKAKRELGFIPKIKIDEGMKRMVRWILKQEAERSQNDSAQGLRFILKVAVGVVLLALLFRRR